MPQARLPDINVEFITYRNESRAALKIKNYDAMFGAVFAENALLPEEYRIKISTKEYNKLARFDIMASCGFCQQDTEYDSLKTNDKLLSPFEQMLAGKETVKVWTCHSCGKMNRIDKTKRTQQVRPKPYFLRVVPDPPERKDGIIDRRKYHKEVSKWYWNFIGELASQEAIFRENYKPQGEELEVAEFDATGEETD